MKRLILGLGLLGLVAAPFWLTSSQPAMAELQADGELKWFRGNMHTHSHWSDGDDFLENIGLWYREHDYDFLVFSDHNTLAQSERWVNVDKLKGGRVSFEKLQKLWGDKVETRMKDGVTEVRLKRFDEVTELVGIPGEFLLVQGEEISDRFEKSPIHMNVHNVRTLIPPQGGNSVHEVMQNNVNAVIAQRERTGQPMFVHLNHPNFHYGVTAEDLMAVEGENFFEVYNGHPGVHNHGDHVHVSTERIWDIILTRRITEFGLPLMYGLATDDGHNYHNIPSRASEPGRAWVMVLARELTPEALINALEAGQFYASNGVALDRIASGPQGIEIAIHEEPGVTYVTEFIGTREGFDATSQPVLDDKGNEVRATRIYSKDVGQVMGRVEGPKVAWHFRGDELYVRARITSSRMHPNPSEPGDFESAWIQPVRRVPDSKDTAKAGQ